MSFRVEASHQGIAAFPMFVKCLKGSMFMITISIKLMKDTEGCLLPSTTAFLASSTAVEMVQNKEKGIAITPLEEGEFMYVSPGHYSIPIATNDGESFIDKKKMKNKTRDEKDFITTWVQIPIWLPCLFADLPKDTWEAIKEFNETHLEMKKGQKRLRGRANIMGQFCERSRPVVRYVGSL